MTACLRSGKPSGYDRWLGIEPDPHDLLINYPSEAMTMWPISTRVNKPENDDPTLLERIGDRFEVGSLEVGGPGLVGVGGGDYRSRSSLAAPHSLLLISRSSNPYPAPPCVIALASSAGPRLEGTKKHSTRLPR